MHKYLRSLGFQKYKKIKELDRVVRHMLEDSDGSSIYLIDADNESFEEHLKANPEGEIDLGISAIERVSKSGRLLGMRYFPYIINPYISSTSECSMEERINGESYVGILEDSRVGVSIIFTINNMGEMLKECRRLEKDYFIKAVGLSALSIEGKVLLPIKKSNEQKAADIKERKNHDSMVEAAKKGDEKAMEALAIEDVNLVADITRRLCHEDIYSIVDSCFMPCGIECDLYSVIGEIEEVIETINIYTGKDIYILFLNCNDVSFPVAINTDDLKGEPKAGRRFKGNVWMQGKVWIGTKKEENQVGE